MGRSMMGIISLGIDLVIGKNRVPKPAAGITAFILERYPIRANLKTHDSPIFYFFTRPRHFFAKLSHGGRIP